MRSKLALVGVLLCFTSVRAQVNTSTIAGVVTDESGSAVPNVKIIATLPSMGLQREVSRNENGEYVVPQIPPGVWNLSARANGFQAANVEKLTLNIAERAVVKITMKLGAVTETVTVSGSATPCLSRRLPRSARSSTGVRSTTCRSTAVTTSSSAPCHPA